MRMEQARIGWNGWYMLESAEQTGIYLNKLEKAGVSQRLENVGLGQNIQEQAKPGLIFWNRLDQAESVWNRLSLAGIGCQGLSMAYFGSH